MIKALDVIFVTLLVCPAVWPQAPVTKINSVTYTGDNSTVSCPISGDYTFPTWKGPPGTTLYSSGTEFNTALDKYKRLSWAPNKRDMLISDTILLDNGVYICTKTVNGQVHDGDNTVMVRVRPKPPTITTTEPEDTDGVRASEGQAFTITCISSGGNPAPNVVLYKGSINGEVLVNTREGVPVGTTYTVTLSYTLTPTREDDQLQLICRSYYPTPETNQASQLTRPIRLNLNLKPSKPTLSPTDPVRTGSNITVECKTNGSRPAANISWALRGETLSGATTVTQDDSMQTTFTTVSVLRKTVNSSDNGQNLTCRVSHLTGDLSATRKLNIQFVVPSSSTRITGNRTIVANGANPLSLTCTTGSSNPASDIIWKKGNSVVNGHSTSDQPGENNGVIRSQVLTLKPTRDDNGETVTCSVSSAVSLAADIASVTLALHYRPLVTIQNSPVIVNEQTTVLPVDLPCIVDSNPPSNVTWCHNDVLLNQASGVSSLSYSISSPSRTSYGSYTCTADNGVALADSKTYTVVVQFRPLNITIKKSGTITANGKNTMSVSCVTGSSNPIAVVTWSTGSIQAVAPVNSSTNGEYGGTVVTSTILLKPTRKDDGTTVTCTARNNLFANRPVSASSTIDNIKYSPLIETLTDQNVTEGDEVVLKCQASSKPAAMFIWANSSTTVANGSGTERYNGLDFTVTNVTRAQAGTYTCTADNSILPNDSKQARLVVQYPPVVFVIAVNTTVHSQTTTLTCGALGVPDHYSYEKWMHTFNGVEVSHPDPLSASQNLTFTDLSYANSGVYRCGASNGVKGVVSYGEETLLVQSFPVLIGEIEKSKAIKTSGQLTKPTVVTFQYYSNAGNGIVKVLNGSGEEVGEIHNRSVVVKLWVFQSEIATPGTEVTINITMAEESQFGEYQIIVQNNIQPVNLSLVILPLGPPETPVFVNSTIRDHRSVNITWISGFPNGMNQTFIIQLSTDNSTWLNITQYGGMSFQKSHSVKIDDLLSSQLYFVRILAVNGEGESQPTGIFRFETAATPESTTVLPIALIAGGIGGGTVAALVVIAVIVFIVWRRRKSPSGEIKDERALVLSSNHNEGYDSRDEEVINRLYESAGPRETETVVGASSSRQALDSGNIYVKDDKKHEVVYAMPNKQKGGKKTKVKTVKRNTQAGDVYENAPDTMFDKKGTPKSGESVYEDTSITAPATPKKPPGTDGLLYADLEFGPKRTGPSKIIGIEDKCEYTTIDLTKKAQPLPDSDDEGKK